MDENITKTISYISAVLFMLGAVTLFFILYRGSSGAIGLVNRIKTDKGAVYQSKFYDSAKTVTGADIVGSIRSGLETDICIDTVFVYGDADVNNFHTFDYSLVDSEALYSVEYIFSPSGEVCYILYRKQ